MPWLGMNLMAWGCSVKELALQPRHQPQPKPGLVHRGFGGEWYLSMPLQCFHSPLHSHLLMVLCVLGWAGRVQELRQVKKGMLIISCTVHFKCLKLFESPERSVA